MLGLILVIAFLVGALGGILALMTGVKMGKAFLVGGAAFAGAAALAVTLLQFLID